MTTTRIRPCGEAALLLDCADLAEAVALAEKIERAQTGAVDVVAAARTVLVTARQASELPRLRRTLEALLGQAPSPGLPHSPSSGLHRTASPAPLPTPGAEVVERDSGGRHVVTLDVRYDGPDLADVAETAGVSIEALVRMHTSITWRAAFGGFAPGFFYLVDARELDVPEIAAPELAARELHTGEPAAREFGARDADSDGPGVRPQGAADAGSGPRPLPTVPRLSSPRPRVPAGSVAVADRFCAVYPGASPGGWRLLGTTDALLWDLTRPRPALLEPGTLVRFRDLGGAGRGADGGDERRNADGTGAAP